MPDPRTIVRTYIEMWNETDPQRRRQLVTETVTEDAAYLDPVMAGNGPDGISEMIGGAQQQFPGHRFELMSGPDAHHDRVRFTVVARRGRRRSGGHRGRLRDHRGRRAHA